MVALTYPLIGNYGTNDEDAESLGPQVAGFIVREMSSTPSNYRSEASGDEYLKRHNIVGIQGVDVRALTKKLRDSGVMMGMITSEHAPAAGLEILRALPDYDSGTYARQVSTQEAYQWQMQGTRDKGRVTRTARLFIPHPSILIPPLPPPRALWCSITAPSSTFCEACASAA